MEKITFGTDGVRGKANEELTGMLAYRLAQAASRVLGQNPSAHRVAIARDTRISGHMLESALASGLMSNGLDAVLCGVMPTPAMGFLIDCHKADFGIMISASHNPYEDNGIKLFSSKGIKLADAIEAQIEEEYINGAENANGGPIGVYSHDSSGRNYYIHKVSQYIGKQAINGLKIAVDCANGAASSLAADLFAALNAHALLAHCEPDGYNINTACGSTHPESIAQITSQTGSDLGLAFDGDADRLIACTSEGEILDGDALLYIFANYLKGKGMLPERKIAITVMSNSGLASSLRKNGISVVETGVGDRYVLEEMLASGIALGGEQSGHIINMAFSSTGDGIANGAALAKIMCETGKSAKELVDGYEPNPQVTINANVSNKSKEKTMGDSEICIAIEKLTAKYKNQGKVLVRASGTEAKIRVMVEGADLNSATQDAKELAAFIEKRAGQL
ncbi:MAG: phosphoglucosamine mutase [Eubacteriaceae bacterium]|nr:phosphoglucosamine mutase [Eubacteriaceae bacterium]